MRGEGDGDCVVLQRGLEVKRSVTVRNISLTVGSSTDVDRAPGGRMATSAAGNNRGRTSNVPRSKLALRRRKHESQEIDSSRDRWNATVVSIIYTRNENSTTIGAAPSESVRIGPTVF